MHPFIWGIIFVAKYGSAAIIGEVARDAYRSAKKRDLTHEFKNQVDLVKEYWHNRIQKIPQKNTTDTQ